MHKAIIARHSHWAGGGGGVLLFSPEPEFLEKLREDLKGLYREIPFKIRSKGHEIPTYKTYPELFLFNLYLLFTYNVVFSFIIGYVLFSVHLFLIK